MKNKVRLASGNQLNTRDAGRPFFTVVMPVHNAEKFLDRAVKSIVSQSFKRFELIIVDDCSTDESYDLILDWTRRDFRIRAYQTHENVGAAEARNRALDRVNGAYVTFVDADDWIESNTFETAEKILREDPAIDCLKFSCTEDYTNSKNDLVSRVNCFCGETSITNRQELFEKIVDLEMIPLFGYVWNGFYRTAALQKYQISFDENLKVNEDFVFNLDFFKHLQKLRTINFLGYHYTKSISGGSLSTDSKNYSYEVMTARIRGLLALFEYGLPDRMREKIFWLYVRACYSSLVNTDIMRETVDAMNQDFLYQEFKRTKFSSSTLKQSLMITFLKYKPLRPILILAVIFIRIVRKIFPGTFAKIKR